MAARSCSSRPRPTSSPTTPTPAGSPRCRSSGLLPGHLHARRLGARPEAALLSPSRQRGAELPGLGSAPYLYLLPAITPGSSVVRGAAAAITSGRCASVTARTTVIGPAAVRASVPREAL